MLDLDTNTHTHGITMITDQGSEVS